MMAIKALVVDDEPLAREELSYLLAETGRVEVAGTAANGEEALAAAAALRPDCVFLDVQMPGLDGFAVAAHLAELPHPPAVVFVTAYDEYALRAFEVHAMDYLLKPVDTRRLARSVQRVAQLLQHPAQAAERLEGFLARVKGSAVRRLPLEKDGRVRLVPPEQVYLAYSIEHGSRVRLDDGDFETRFTLQELESRLAAGPFVRVHRQYLVNLERVREFVPWFNGTASLVMGDRQRSQVPVSRTRLAAVRRHLGID